LEILRKTRRELEEFFVTPPHEPFFVKNLENVQGDERDVILFANWLALCLPREEELQDQVLREISLWAREPRRFVSELMARV
jgi:hypothetical protein